MQILTLVDFFSTNELWELKAVCIMVNTEVSKTQKVGDIIMKIHLSENLRKLRFKNHLTQEQLAEIFTVSPQAISRWENGSTYPDITMLPSIANYFNISLDELMGMEEIRKSVKISDIYANASKYREDNMLDEAINMLRDGIKVYPNNYGFLSELALTLTLKSNSESDDDLVSEAISLSERVLKNSTSEKLRSTTIANLCFLYLKANEHEKAKNLVNSLPHIWECREFLLAEMHDDAEYPAELRKSIVKALLVIYEKIKNYKNHKYTNPDYIIASGVDFNLDGDIKKKLELIVNFFENDSI